MYPACSRSAIRGSGFVYHMYRAVVAARHSSYIHLSSPPPPPHTSPPPPTPPHRRLLPYPPPLYLSNRIHFLFDLFQFYVELCFILAWLAFYIYSTHPYSRLFFFSRSRRSSSVSIKTATVGAPRALSVPLHIGHLFTVAYLAKK